MQCRMVVYTRAVLLFDRRDACAVCCIQVPMLGSLPHIQVSALPLESSGYVLQVCIAAKTRDCTLRTQDHVIRINEQGRMYRLSPHGIIEFSQVLVADLITCQV